MRRYHSERHVAFLSSHLPMHMIPTKHSHIILLHITQLNERTHPLSHATTLALAWVLMDTTCLGPSPPRHISSLSTHLTSPHSA